MTFPTHCPICEHKLSPVISYYPDSKEWCCQNINCTSMENYVYFCVIPGDETRVVHWGIPLLYNDKYYYIRSNEDSLWEEDEINGIIDDFIMIPRTDILFDNGKLLISIKKFYPHPSENVKENCHTILKKVLSLVPFK